MMTRRFFLTVLGATPLVAGLPVGGEERVWVALQHLGVDVTERLSAGFRWDAAMEVLVTGRELMFDGTAIYLGEHDGEPFRARTFEPIRMGEGFEVKLAWEFRRS